MIRPKSKLPFRIHLDEEFDTLHINSIGFIPIGVSKEDAIPSKDIEFIVHACNNYEKLITKLKQCQQVIDERCQLTKSFDNLAVYNAISHSMNIESLLKELKEI